MRGRKLRPAALRRGKERSVGPTPPDALPRCPAHLDAVARKELRRLATPLYRMGVLTVADRGSFAACCQAWSRWVEAEEQLQKTPLLLKTPSGYVQQSPWLSIANKQMELMGRYMAEMGLTPASRMRVAASAPPEKEPLSIVRVIWGSDARERADGGDADADGDLIEGTSRPVIRLPLDVDKV